ncbi:MAG: nucleotide exchange factor GrpE [Gemmatimonadales bacterium]
MTEKRQPIAPSGPPPGDKVPAEPQATTPPEESAPAPPAPPAATDGVELEALRDRHLRLAAEYDNFRKRVAKERAESWLRAQAELVARLAESLDDLSRFARLDPGETDPQAMHEGVELVERKLWKELEAAGVTRIDQTGVPFDPHVHEAVTMQAAAVSEQDHTIGQVLQAGYKLRDILLRPARVVVLTWQGD